MSETSLAIAAPLHPAVDLRWRRLLLVLWSASLLAALALGLVYRFLPVDGGTGDLGSLGPDGFRVLWLLEQRPGGLEPDDLIVRAGGKTPEEWLHGASRGTEWDSGGTVVYEIIRAGERLSIEISPRPVPFLSVAARWVPQLAIALALLVIGAYVVRRREHDRAARLLMLFSFFTALQYWGDAYNVQFVTLVWRWPFWLHLVYEHVTYAFAVSSVCNFALVFPVTRPFARRHPGITLHVLFGVPPLAIAISMLLSPTLSGAVATGNTVSWVVAIVEIAIALTAGVVSARTARDPVSRAQVRWIIWCASVTAAVLFPTYVLPLAIGRTPLLPHPVAMIATAAIPLTLGIAILRYRLFDLDVIIHRSLVYIALTILLTGLYLLLIPALTIGFRAVFHHGSDSIVVFVATLVIALAVLPLRLRIQRLIDRAFYRTRMDPQALLPEFSERLAASIDADKLAELLTADVPKRCSVAWATLAVVDAEGGSYVPVLGGNPIEPDHPLVAFLRRGAAVLRLEPPANLDPRAQRYLDSCGIELAVPLEVADELVGIYGLGPKLSGDGYGRDEIRLFELLGKQAAVAMQNARLYLRAQHEIEERRRTEARITISLREKEVLLREVHHRVKNNLQIISSLLFLQSHKTREPAAAEILRESQSRVRSMAFVHEKLYRSENLGQIDLAEYASQLARDVFASYNVAPERIALTVSMESVPLGVDLAVPCGLILSELLTNSLKHAFPSGRAGHISIQANLSASGEATVRFSDDGVGLPEGFEPERSDSLGLQLVGKLVAQIGGLLRHDGSGGTTWIITFPTRPADEGLTPGAELPVPESKGAPT